MPTFLAIPEDPVFEATDLIHNTTGRAIPQECGTGTPPCFLGNRCKNRVRWGRDGDGVAPQHLRRKNRVPKGPGVREPAFKNRVEAGKIQ